MSTEKQKEYQREYRRIYRANGRDNRVNESLLFKKDKTKKMNKVIKNRKYSEEDIMEFLRESNFIEGVRDQDSLLQARRAFNYLLNSKVFTEKTILTAHKILMQNQCLKPKEKGHYRKVQVWIAGREGVEWDKIPSAMSAWIEEAKRSIEIPDEEGKCIKVDHVSFERIHPFVDGNGRIGRIIMNYQRMKTGLPLLIIHEGQEQFDYYSWFR